MVACRANASHATSLPYGVVRLRRYVLTWATYSTSSNAAPTVTASPGIAAETRVMSTRLAHLKESGNVVVAKGSVSDLALKTAHSVLTAPVFREVAENLRVHDTGTMPVTWVLTKQALRMLFKSGCGQPVAGIKNSAVTWITEANHIRVDRKESRLAFKRLAMNAGADDLVSARCLWDELECVAPSVVLDVATFVAVHQSTGPALVELMRRSVLVLLLKCLYTSHLVGSASPSDVGQAGAGDREQAGEDGDESHREGVGKRLDYGCFEIVVARWC